MSHSSVHPVTGKKPSPAVATHTPQGHIAIAKDVLVRLRVNAKRDSVGEINMAIQSLEELGKAIELAKPAPVPAVPEGGKAGPEGANLAP